VNLIEEGMDLAIRITAGSSPPPSRGVSPPAASSSPPHPTTSPATARRGARKTSHHECLGYTANAAPSWTFTSTTGCPIPLRARLTASNGDVLTEAAARGMGITCQPDFILDPWLPMAGW
jgi:DNA-binding transcriptional LysR family regulator